MYRFLEDWLSSVDLVFGMVGRARGLRPEVMIGVCVVGCC